MSRSRRSFTKLHRRLRSHARSSSSPARHPRERRAEDLWWRAPTNTCKPVQGWQCRSDCRLKERRSSRQWLPVKDRAPSLFQVGPRRSCRPTPGTQKAAPLLRPQILCPRQLSLPRSAGQVIVDCGGCFGRLARRNGNLIQPFDHVAGSE